jgi:hypothetical protein
MSEQKYSIDADIKEAQDIVNALESYIHSSEVYGKTGGIFGGGPSVTIGMLLMRLHRLRALQDRLTDSQRAALDAIQAKHDSVRKEWTMHYDEKLVREANSRLDAMKPWFDDCNAEPRTCAGNYPPEALRRTVVQELLDAISAENVDSGGLTAKVRTSDQRLRRFAQPDGFIWDPVLQPVYPQSTYWWLYARPQAS